MLEQNNLELRKKAYEIIQRKGSDISLKFENSDLKTLLHELDVYQAELEAQNEELRDKEAKLYNSQLEYESLFMDATMGFVLLDNKLEIQNINNMARAYFAYRFLNEKNKMFISLIARNGIESFFNWIDKKEYLKKHLEIDLLCDSGAKSFRLDAKPYLLKDKWIVLTLENIENEKLFALKRLENYKAVLYTLADLIEKRDPYTAGHSKRVATYAKKIANKMHLPKEKCDMIYEAGILHDIGKIVIPDSILLKPSRLNDNEFKITQLSHIENHKLTIFKSFIKPHK
jgi:HD-GYP domain-containing protein (c-di-GMP phosphodiesterase class II)